MLSLPTFTIGIALLIAFGLVGFGIIRLMKHFQEEFRRENDPKETPYTLDTAPKKQ